MKCAVFAAAVCAIFALTSGIEYDDEFAVKRKKYDKYKVFKINPSERDREKIVKYLHSCKLS